MIVTTDKPTSEAALRSMNVEALPRSMPLLAATGRLLVGLIMIVLCVAGFAKLWDLSAFQKSLLTWRYLPDSAVRIAWVALPTAESLLAVLWSAGIRRRACERAALAMLAAMSAAIAVHWVRGENPTCNCIGALIRHLDEAAEVRVLLARALALFTMMLLGHLLLLYTDPRAHRPMSVPGKLVVRTRGAPGTTLVETLISITTIAVLIALLTAGISGARKASRLSRTLGYLGQHGSVLSIYASDWRDSFPMFADPANPPHSVAAAGQTVTFNTYFSSHEVWHWALMDQYYDGVPREAFSDVDLQGVPFAMSCTVFASPPFWQLETREAGTSQITASRHSQTAFPSNKAVLVSLARFYKDFVPGGSLPDARTMVEGVPTLAADGHGASRAGRRFAPGIQIGEMTPGFSGAYHTFDLFVGLHTERGVRGRDWQ